MPLFPLQMNCVAYIMLCLLHTAGRDSRYPVCSGMPCLLHTACQIVDSLSVLECHVTLNTLQCCYFTRWFSWQNNLQMGSLDSWNNLVNCLSFSSDTEESDNRFLGLPGLGGTSGASNGRQPLNTRKKIVNSTNGDKKSTDVRSQFPETWLWDLYIIG